MSVRLVAKGHLAILGRPGEQGERTPPPRGARSVNLDLRVGRGLGEGASDEQKGGNDGGKLDHGC